MLLKRIACLLFTALILLADSGQTIYAHTCIKEDHTIIGLMAPPHCDEEAEVKADACCAKKAAQKQADCALGISECCKVKSTFIKQFFPNRLAQEDIAIIAVFALVNPLCKIQLPLLNTVAVYTPSNNSPPPLSYTPEFTGVFRI